jgi:hypothetical protein
MRILGQTCRTAVLYHPTRFNYHDPLEAAGLPHIVGYAEKGGPFVKPPHPLKQISTLRAVQTAKRLIENDEPCCRSDQGTPQADALSLPAGEQPSALAQDGLEPIG